MLCEKHTLQKNNTNYVHMHVQKNRKKHVKLRLYSNGFGYHISFIFRSIEQINLYKNQIEKKNRIKRKQGHVVRKGLNNLTGQPF